MHMLFAMMAHALVYIGMWQLVRHYHLSPWLVLGAGVVLSLLFRRSGGRRGRRYIKPRQRKDQDTISGPG